LTTIPTNCKGRKGPKIAKYSKEIQFFQKSKKVENKAHNGEQREQKKSNF
jgi:hypothetical protein